MHACFASCPKGIEPLLADELQTFGALEIKQTVSGVTFSANLETLYRSCLWSRFASRVYHTLGTFPVKQAQDVYSAATQIHWDEHFSPEQPFMVDFIGTNQEINNSQFGALKVKDAVVDYFQNKYQQRPDVDKQYAQCRINARLHHGQVTLSLDMTGRALHERGYRKASGLAPLKENLAAAVLARSGWTPDKPLLDPMCGAGTLVIEAAMQAANIAPGLRREFLFEDWKQHDRALWVDIRNEALHLAQEGEKNVRVQFYGCDIDARVLEKAKTNAKNAGVSDRIEFTQQAITDLDTPDNFDNGVVVINPPYGERLETQVSAITLYYQLGDRLRHAFNNARCAVLCPDKALLSCLRLRALKKYRLFNGALDCELRCFELNQNTGSKSGVAEDFGNRLRKNLKARTKWLKKANTNAYRLYDADLPDYNFAIDCYDDHLVIQEYARPADIPETKAQQRLYDALYQCVNVLEVDSDKIVLKTRQRQRGDWQYTSLDDQGDYVTVIENDVKLYANLYDYLDTGVFLDHRPMRHFIQQHAQGKRFLNLFCYTGAATVHAAAGGARTTVSVDLSKTYLAWAKRNLQLNNQLGRNHHLIQDDCIEWIKDCRDQFDLIFLDPPTFSNSKRMADHFEVQADYLQLLAEACRVLSDDGMLIFSNNKRGFKLDEESVTELGFTIENKTADSIPFDFKGRRSIHQCWVLRK